MLVIFEREVNEIASDSIYRTSMELYQSACSSTLLAR
jgi:hypothetical protein